MADESHFKMFTVAGDLAGFCQEMSSDLAADLGESPEAWRGAAVMGFFIKACCTADATTHDLELEPDFEPSELVLHLLLTVAMLEQYPTWPKGEEYGPPLIQNGDPPNEPHFRRVKP